MATPGEEQYSVVMEWLDPQSNLIRKFHGTFFAVDSTIQLFDVANKRVFLKRVAPPEGVKADDLYVQPTNQLAWWRTFAQLFPLAAGLQWANDMLSDNAGLLATR